MNSNKSDIEEYLLLNYLLDKCELEEKNRIEAWLNESSAHREQLDELESLWIETGKLDPPPVVVDREAAWAKMEGRMGEEGRGKIEEGRGKREEGRGKREEGKRVAFRESRFYWGAAAGILLLIGIYSIYQWMNRPIKQMEFVADRQMKSDTLPDGSSITLQGGSKLIYPEKFTGSTREVKLTGTAFFKVRHDPSMPFIIDAGGARVKVLGTSFQVKANKDSAVEVMVTQGRVMLFKVNAVKGDTASIILLAGNKGILPVKTLIPMLVENNNPGDLFWLDHTLEFKGTPLSTVFALLEKYYPVSIKVKNDKINNCLLTATFADDPIDWILEIIALSFDLSVSSTDQIYIISGNGCSEGNK